MAVKIAPAARAVLEQASDLWPARSTASDGLRGDPAHAQRRSWHNPSRRDGSPDPRNGTVYAVDLTHDPAVGCDAHAFVRAAVARRDRRVLEAISNDRIWTKARAAEGWRAYGGQNPHRKHAHLTVDPKHATDTSPWWPTVAAAPPPTPGGFTMTPDEARQIEEIVDRIVRKHAVAILRGKDQPSSLDKIKAAVDRIALKLGA